MSVNPDNPHCPFVAGAGSYSRSHTEKKPQVWIDNSMPYLFAAGESVIETVTYNEHQVFKAIFLPKVCTLPTGIFWPTTTSYKDFLRSLALSATRFLSGCWGPSAPGGSGACHWFEAVNANCTSFKLLRVPLQPIIHQIFPSFIDGSYNREYIQYASSDFSPMMEMINCFLWHLQVDTHLLSSGSKAARQALEHCLDSGAASLKISLKYLPPNINPRVCPNFANHFVVKGGWPPQSHSPLLMLQSPGLVSDRVLQYKVIDLDLTSKDLSIIPPLQMNDEVSFGSHLSQQHGGSRPLKTIRASSSGAVLPKGIMAALIPPSLSGKHALAIDHLLWNDIATLLVGSSQVIVQAWEYCLMWLVYIPLRQWIMSCPSSFHLRWFSKLLLASLALCSPVAILCHRRIRQWILPKRISSAYKILAPFSICSQLEHNHLHCKFTDVCCLLVQPAPDQVRITMSCVGSPASPIARKFMGHWLMLVPLEASFSSYWAYFQAMHYHDQEDTQSIQLWHIHLCFLLCLASYSFLGLQQWCSPLHGPWGQNFSCLPVHSHDVRSCQGHPYLIPSKGLTLQEANDLGYLMLTLFSVIDIGKDFGKCYINISELGSWLLEWRCDSMSHFHHGHVDSSPSSCHLWMAQVIENVTPHLPALDNVSAHVFEIMAVRSSPVGIRPWFQCAWMWWCLVSFAVDCLLWWLNLGIGIKFLNVSGCNNLEMLMMLSCFVLCRQITCC